MNAAAIAAAVEEQGAATREIARNVQQAAKDTGYASEQVLSASSNPYRRSEMLRGEAETFLSGIKSA